MAILYKQAPAQEAELDLSFDFLHFPHPLDSVALLHKRYIRVRAGDCDRDSCLD